MHITAYRGCRATKNQLFYKYLETTSCYKIERMENVHFSQIDKRDPWSVNIKSSFSLSVFLFPSSFKKIKITLLFNGVE